MDLLQSLKETQGDTHAQAAVAAKFLLLTLPEAERETFHHALDAAAVLRWFDANLLRKVLKVSIGDALNRFEAISLLPFVEGHRRGAGEVHNIHESTRLGWRKNLASQNIERFRTLSLRCASCFNDNETPAGRIEWIGKLFAASHHGNLRHLDDDEPHYFRWKLFGH